MAGIFEISEIDASIDKIDINKTPFDINCLCESRGDMPRLRSKKECY